MRNEWPCVKSPRADWSGLGFLRRLWCHQIDDRRTSFYHRYIAQVARAIHDGADVRGYYAWSLLDNFEWAEGYSQRFGLVYVDYPTQRRIIKKSGYWYRDLIATNRLQ